MTEQEQTIQHLTARIAWLKQTYQQEMTRLRDDYQAALDRRQVRIDELEAILEAAQPPESETDRVMEQHIQEIEARWQRETSEREAAEDDPPRI